MNHIKTIPYKVYAIKFFNLKYNNELGINIIREKFRPEAIFKVTAIIQDDIYNLYCYDSKQKTYLYGNAMISSYKCSVMMNSLFRKIKENDNLDLLEESDDEEEFENINENKYVDLNKTLLMKCVYSERFNKWEPVEVVKNNLKIITKQEAYILEKKV